MARLVVRKLKYSGELYEFESPPMDDGINIIEGANGTGKTTFTELLYFCLSGTADMLNPAKPHKHKEILSDKNNYVEALIQIDAAYFLISRYIRSNDITVKYSDGELEIFPIYRRGNNRIFSDWFLEKLGIELIELAMGSKKWMINIKDIFRLIYHDQAPNPIDVYKVPDTEGFITDSKVMRKAIFEVLLGKSLHEYYRLLGELRAAEANRSKVKGAAELYRQMLEEIKQDQGDLNLAFLNKELENKNDQLQKLESYLESLYITPSMPKEVLAQVEQQKAELIECQMKIIQQRRKESELLDEIIKLRKVRSDLITETTQIKKMVYTHDQLSLFSADTCPYCLRYVQRTKGKCVCGADVDESKYERFFYSSEEYIDILKSKQKSVDTVDNAIEGISAELRAVMDAISSITSRVRVIESQIEKRISDSDRPIDIERTKELGGKIATIRFEITLLEQQISLESKRQDIENEIIRADTEFATLSKKVDKLYADANLEMDERIKKFNKTYNDLMQECVTDCRRAYLDSDYMPVINDGEYREASAAVPLRLMYFLTLLHLSLTNPAVSFPRFLLIDTPETSGIDKENLLKAFECFSKVIPDDYSNDYQIILLTGIGKYPAMYSNNVKLTLTEDARLLKER